MRRRIFVGDVQGCRRELETLLERVRFDPARDELHPVGDLVNRGPDSLGVLRLLSSFKKSVVGGVLGNHDLALLRSARGKRPLRPQDTIDDVLGAKDRDELLAWLAARPFVRTFEDVVLVHAGFSPTWKHPVRELKHEDPYHPGEAASFAVRVRWCDKQGRLFDDDPGKPKNGARPWYELFDRSRIGGRKVVFGHWARQGLLVKKGFRGLDSGCVWGKELSAWIPEDDRIVQVPARKAYATVG